MLPVKCLLGELAGSGCDSLDRLWRVGLLEAAGAVCFKV